jgi:hypothetical protein
MTHIAAIDPGLSGAVAIIHADTGELVHAEQLKTVPLGSGELVDAVALARVLRDYNVVHTVIENVHTRPGQGIASNGTFMCAKGVVYGVAAVHGSVSWVVPSVWKRHHNLIGQDKEASRTYALTVFGEPATRFFVPKRKVLTLRQARDLADASLIAKWYVQTGGKTITQLKKIAQTAISRLPSIPPASVQ